MSQLWQLTSRTRSGRPCTIAVAPDRGGKIVSLASGIEWLAQAGTGLLASPSGLAFVEAEMCGWDECAPTIDPGTLVDGTRLSDHGDLWDATWHGTGATLTAQGSDWPYRLTRTVAATDGGFLIDYVVWSEDVVPRPFLWAAHPQFLAGADSWVELDSSALIDVANPGARLRNDPGLQRVQDGHHRKLWTPRDERVHAATLRHADGSALRIDWTGEAVRWCGVWVDARSFSRERVIAIEPSTAWYDDVVRAHARGSVLVLEPGGSAAWSLRVTLDDPF